MNALKLELNRKHITLFAVNIKRAPPIHIRPCDDKRFLGKLMNMIVLYCLNGREMYNRIEGCCAVQRERRLSKLPACGFSQGSSPPPLPISPSRVTSISPLSHILTFLCTLRLPDDFLPSGFLCLPKSDLLLGAVASVVGGCGNGKLDPALARSQTPSSPPLHSIKPIHVTNSTQLYLVLILFEAKT